MNEHRAYDHALIGVQRILGQVQEVVPDHPDIVNEISLRLLVSRHGSQPPGVLRMLVCIEPQASSTAVPASRRLLSIVRVGLSVGTPSDKSCVSELTMQVLLSVVNKGKYSMVTDSQQVFHVEHVTDWRAQPALDAVAASAAHVQAFWLFTLCLTILAVVLGMVSARWLNKWLGV